MSTAFLLPLEAIDRSLIKEHVLAHFPLHTSSTLIAFLSKDKLDAYGTNMRARRFYNLRFCKGGALAASL